MKCRQWKGNPAPDKGTDINQIVLHRSGAWRNRKGGTRPRRLARRIGRMEMEELINRIATNVGIDPALAEKGRGDHPRFSPEEHAGRIRRADDGKHAGCGGTGRHACPAGRRRRAAWRPHGHDGRRWRRHGARPAAHGRRHRHGPRSAACRRSFSPMRRRRSAKLRDRPDRRLVPVLSQFV